MSGSVFSLVIIALNQAALALIIGVCCSRLWLLARHNPETDTTARLVHILGWALLLLLFSSLVTLLLRSAEMMELGLIEALPFIPKVLTRSQFGALWQWQMTTWLGMALLWLWLWAWRRDGSNISYVITAVGAIITAFLFSSAGHAGDDGKLVLANMVNTLHITSACVWGGTVTVYAFSILPGQLRQRPSSLPWTVASATRLSSIAGMALAVVLLTGLYNAWHYIDDITQLWRSDYGLTLLVKLLIVATMMTIGALNLFFFVPAIRHSGAENITAVRRFLHVLRFDTGIFMLILLAAVILASQAPPAHEDNAHHARHTQMPVTNTGNGTITAFAIT